MKTIGLIGGMSWESSLEYYRVINETVKERLGGLHSAKCIMYSLNFNKIAGLQYEDKWEELTQEMIEAAQRLKKAGADYIVICSNTMHKTADEVQNVVGIPVLHIADAAAEKIIKKRIEKVGLMGTKFSMEGDFYKKRLQEKHNLEVIIPSEEDREIINNVIYNELCLGVLKQSSREKFKEIINKLVSSGAEGIVLGCTEIPLLIKQEDVDVPVFDTMTIHSVSAVDFTL
ncbi:aspartate/glutamate racemase family protein [Wukongibacter baidiensis]|uniref:aspartate/glutamate racemase family protein n=1 Tax=Wukongibacter baidiensis TaxID=1723361 RepID=UPI003D7F918D